jgi:hypothetical protein
MNNHLSTSLSSDRPGESSDPNGAVQNPRSVDAGSSGCAPGTPKQRRIPAWTEATYTQIREWLAAGVSGREIANRLGVYKYTLSIRCERAGIALPTKHEMTPEGKKAAEAVLFAHFATEPDVHLVYALYREARGDDPTMPAMIQHAAKHGLRRPTRRITPETQALGREAIAAQHAARKAEQAERVQKLLDQRLPVSVVTERLGLGEKAVRRLIRDGLVTRPAPLPKPPRPVKVKAPRPIKPPAPRKLPASYVRAPAPPPPPKPTYETVEAWLAAGNAITRCPTAAASYTTATIPEADRLALTALYAEREANKIKRVGSAWRNK